MCGVRISVYKTTARQTGAANRGRCEYVLVALDENVPVFRHPGLLHPLALHSLKAFILTGAVQSQISETGAKL